MTVFIPYDDGYQDCIISTLHKDAAFGHLVNYGLSVASSLSGINTPDNGGMWIWPFVVRGRPFPFSKMVFESGSGTPQQDVGVYDKALQRIASTGMATRTTGHQSISAGGTFMLAPGQYYFAWALATSSAAAVQGHFPASAVFTAGDCGLMYSSSGGNPLPADAGGLTFTRDQGFIIPMVSITSLAVI